MRGLKLIGILLFGLFFQIASHAQDWNTSGFQSAEEQRIREMHLLEWYAQEQAQQQSHSYNNIQNTTQNVSLNQPYQQTPAPVAAPEREDLFNAANAGNIQQISKLLSQGLDVNVSNNQRETALHMAAARGHYEAVIFLVRSGAYINAPTVKKNGFHYITPCAFAILIL